MSKRGPANISICVLLVADDFGCRCGVTKKTEFHDNIIARDLGLKINRNAEPFKGSISNKHLSCLADFGRLLRGCGGKGGVE